MNMMDILRRFVHYCGTNPEKATMDYCFAHGFTTGKNFQYNSGYPIDANWPWLISVGDDVTLASNVRILAHDASTAKAGAHTQRSVLLRSVITYLSVQTALCFVIPGSGIMLLLEQVQL